MVIQVLDTANWNLGGPAIADLSKLGAKVEAVPLAPLERIRTLLARWDRQMAARNSPFPRRDRAGDNPSPRELQRHADASEVVLISCFMPGLEVLSVDGWVAPPGLALALAAGRRGVPSVIHVGESATTRSLLPYTRALNELVRVTVPPYWAEWRGDFFVKQGARRLYADSRGKLVWREGQERWQRREISPCSAEPTLAPVTDWARVYNDFLHFLEGHGTARPSEAHGSTLK